MATHMSVYMTWQAVRGTNKVFGFDFVTFLRYSEYPENFPTDIYNPRCISQYMTSL